MWKSIDICVIRKLHLLCSFVYSRLRIQIYKAVAESKVHVIVFWQNIFI